MRIRGLICVALVLTFYGGLRAEDPLPGTKPLMMEGDIASQLVEGVDKFHSSSHSPANHTLRHLEPLCDLCQVFPISN